MPRSYQGLTSYEDYEDMLVEKRDGGGMATLNVPEKLNALSPGIRYGLKRILEDMIDDDDAKVLVLTGAGRGFSSGADLGGGLAASAGQPDRQELTESRSDWINRMRTMNKPIIGAINGVVSGGGLSVALGCDLRIASD